MRFLLLFLASGLVASASAQPAATDSPRFYVAPVIGGAYSSSSGSAFLVGAIAGTRLGQNTDVGVGVFGGDRTYRGTTAFVMLQPHVGRSIPLGDGLVGYVQLAVSALATDLDTATDPKGFGLRVLGSQAEATLSREVPIVGSLRIAPTVGGYGAVCTTVNTEDIPGVGCAEAGVLAGAEVRFTLLGLDAAVPLVFPIRVVGDTYQASLEGVFDLSRRAIPGGVRVRF